MYELLHSAAAPASWLIEFLESGLVYGSLLAVATAILAATVLRRARPAVIAMLWTIVLVKFVVPIGPATPVSLNGLVNAATSDSGASVASSTDVASRIAASVQVTVAIPPAEVAWHVAQTLLLLGYLLAVGWIVTRKVRSHRRLRGRIAELAAPDPAQRAEVDAAAAAVGMRRVPVVRVDPRAFAPMVVGLVSPVLVLGDMAGHSASEREAILIHELAHLLRRDTWLRGLQLVVGTLLFFFPVVGWINRRLDEARERACDEWAALAGRISARDYARLLVRVARGERHDEAAAMGLIFAPAQLERRVDGLLAGRPRPRIGRLGGVVVAAWAVFILGGASSADGQSARQRTNCVVDEQLITRILAEYPEADVDGDGQLSRDEICGHQLRMERRLTDDVTRSLSRGDSGVSWLDSVVDSDGDGIISDDESVAVQQLVSETVRSGTVILDPVAFPGQVCEADLPSACVE